MKKLYFFSILLLAGMTTLQAQDKYQFTYEGITYETEKGDYACKVVKLPESANITIPAIVLDAQQADKPLTVTKIGTMVGNNTIESIVIPKAVDEIEYSAFGYCEKLRSVDIDAQIIGSQAFSYCKNLSEVKLGENVKTIKSGAFYMTVKLDSICLPSEISDLDEAFNGSFIDAIQWNVTTYSKSMSGDGTESPFYGIHRITPEETMNMSPVYTRLYIGNEVTSLPAYVFCNLNITNPLLIPSSASVDENAFFGATISEVIDDSGMQKEIFANAGSVTKVTFTNNVMTIVDKAYQRTPGLEEIEFGNNLQTIGSEAFYMCSDIKEVFIPQNIKEIGSYAFSSTGIKTLYIEQPATQLEIKGSAFSSTQNLTEVRLDITEPNYMPIIDDGDPFGGSNQIQLLMPCGNAYEAVKNCDYSTQGTLHEWKMRFTDGWTSEDEGTSRISNFVPFSIEANVADDSELFGYITIDDEKPCTEGVILTAEGAIYDDVNNYKSAFVCWSDGNKDNPRTLKDISGDVVLYAYFGKSKSDPTGIEQTEARDAVKAQKIIKDGQLYIMYDGKMYDMLGALVEE